MRKLVLVAASFFLLPLGVGAAAAMGAGGSGGSPSTQALATIPPDMLGYYMSAAATCPGLPWEALAAIGTLESANGTSTAPGVHSGLNVEGIAAGPMQFVPSTFAAFDGPVAADPAPTPVPPGIAPPDIYDPVDSVYAAARYLCTLGGGDPSRLPSAILSYSGGSTDYVTQATRLMGEYSSATGSAPGSGSGGGVPPGGFAGQPRSASALHAVLFAQAALGVPYVWGGNGPDGFDCSGLVWAAYAGTPAAFPRWGAADEFTGTAHVPGASSMEPGDLVFFAGGAGEIEHVGIYVGTDGAEAVMIDAPHAGATVRYDDFDAAPGASWGDEYFDGATAPLEHA